MFDFGIMQLFLSTAQLGVSTQNMGYNRVAAVDTGRSRIEDKQFQAELLALLKGNYYEGAGTMYDKIRQDARTHMGMIAQGNTPAGAADTKAMHDWANEACHGEACKLKTELMPLVAMIVPNMTATQLDLAEDRLKAFKKKAAMLSDPTAKAEVDKWLDRIGDELEEFEGSAKYERKAKETGRKEYSDMAADERRHAETLRSMPVAGSGLYPGV